MLLTIKKVNQLFYMNAVSELISLDTEKTPCRAWEKNRATTFYYNYVHF